MSLKNDIKMVREELNSEEKFFEKAVVTEKFVKKYKKVLIGSVVAITLFVAGSIAYNLSEKNRIDSANEVLLELQKNSENKTSIARLETLSPALHDVWLYSVAIVGDDFDALEKLQSSKAAFVSDLSSYAMAKSLKQFETYSQKQDAVFEDLSQIQSAILLMNINKIDEAHQKLSMINIQSPLSKIAKALMHYGVQ